LCALLLAPAACTGNDDDVPDPEPPPVPQQLASCATAAPADASADNPVRIVFSHTESGPLAGEIVRLVDRFNAAHPDVRVLVDPAVNGAGSLLEDWSEKEPEARPALALLPKQQLGVLADSGQTVAPGSCLREAVPDLLPAVEESWALDGELQAVPLGVSTPVLYYNRYLFEAAGLDPNAPPETFDEVLELAPTLMDEGPSDRAWVFDTGAEAGGSWYVEQTLAKAGLPSLLPDNGRRERPAEEVNWDAPPAVDALTWLQTMHAQGRTAWVQRNSDATRDLLRAAAPGRMVPMLVHTSASLGALIEVLGSGATSVGTAEVDLEHVELGIAPMPGPGPGSLVGGNALWLSAGHSERETQAAWRFAAWMASPEVNAEWAAATSYIPLSTAAARQPVLVDLWRAHPQLREPYRVVAEQPTTPEALGPVAGPLPELHDILADAVKDIVIDGDDPAETLERAADEAEGLLAAYNAAQPDRSG
jgi:sn-glycerol 3-phosphate transport system substrate-binding protein